MPAPEWIDQGGEMHRLLVGQDDVAGLVRLAHQVEDARGLGEVEVEIGLHAPVVDVGRHGVPDRAGRELGHADDELAGLAHVGVDELEDRALVRGLRLPRSMRLASAMRMSRVGWVACAGAERR